MRPRKAVESFRSAAECIGPIEHSMSLFAVTRGQFSMLDMILHCLDQIGPAEISVWTWAIADYEVEAMEGLMARREITGAHLIVDKSADKRSQKTIEAWRTRFGPESVRVVINHAKIARVWNDNFRLLLRGSMNLNFNPRFEQLDITEGGPDFDLVERLEAEIPILPRNYTHKDCESATKVNRAWEHSQLEMFRGAKTWAK